MVQPEGVSSLNVNEIGFPEVERFNAVLEVAHVSYRKKNVNLTSSNNKYKTHLWKSRRIIVSVGLLD